VTKTYTDEEIRIMCDKMLFLDYYMKIKSTTELKYTALLKNSYFYFLNFLTFEKSVPWPLFRFLK
jgi:hypothetical protein